MSTRPRTLLRRETGGIDLPSTMVSILVIAAFLAAAALAVFVVIPWAQDNAARGLAEQVGEAQAAYYPMSGEAGTDQHYGTRDELIEAGLLSEVEVEIAVANGTAADPGRKDRFTATVRSATGARFEVSSEHPGPRPALVLNAGFEDGLEDWSHVGDVQVTSDAYSGDGAARFAGTQATARSSRFDVDPGQIWQVSGHYKVVQASTNRHPQVIAVDRSTDGETFLAWKYVTPENAETGWEHTARNYTVPAGTAHLRLRIASHYSDPDAAIIWDDVHVRPVG